jgi:hypothetical protein
MEAPTTDDLFGLVTASVAAGEDRLEQVYLWRFDRLITVSKSAFGASAAFVAALLAAASPRAWQLVLGLGVSAASLAVGIERHARIGTLCYDYLDTLRIYGLLKNEGLVTE